MVERKGEAWPRPRPCYACLALMLVGIIAFIYLCCTAVGAQEVFDRHQHPADYQQYPAANQKDPYQGIFNFNGVNCCNSGDCRQAVDPKDFEPIENGYRVKPTGEVVPMSTTGFSPDENWHICRKSDAKKTIRCLLVPAGGA